MERTFSVIKNSEIIEINLEEMLDEIKASHMMFLFDDNERPSSYKAVLLSDYLKEYASYCRPDEREAWCSEVDKLIYNRLVYAKPSTTLSDDIKAHIKSNDLMVISDIHRMNVIGESMRVYKANKSLDTVKCLIEGYDYNEVVTSFLKYSTFGIDFINKYDKKSSHKSLYGDDLKAAVAYDKKRKIVGQKLVDALSKGLVMTEEKALLACDKYDSSLGMILQDIINIKKYADRELSSESRFIDREDDNVRYTIERDGNDYLSVINYYNYVNRDSIDIVSALTNGVYEYEIMTSFYCGDCRLNVDGYYDKEDYIVKIGLDVTTGFLHSSNRRDNLDIHIDKYGVQVDQFGMYDEIVDSLGMYTSIIQEYLGDSRKLEKKN